MTEQEQDTTNAVDSKKPWDDLLPHKPDESLLESFRYINSMPGKDVRGKLIDCFQLWFNIPSDEVLKDIKVSSGLWIIHRHCRPLVFANFFQTCCFVGSYW